jgi:high-affinity iron transporter
MNAQVMLVGLVPSFLISFREAFEAVLLMSILISYSKRVNQIHLIKPAYLGGLLGTLISVFIGVILHLLYISIDLDLTEAIASFIAVPVITSVVYWMATKGKEVVYKGVTKAISAGITGVIFTAFVFVFREGLETVLLTYPIMLRDFIGTSIGILLGLILALVIGYLFYRGTLKLSLRLFFTITSIMLILIAGSVLGYGIHEFVEYLEKNSYELGVWSKYVYRLPIDTNHILHDKNILGALLAVMFGYSTKMELIRFIIQIPYQVIGITILLKIYFKPYLKLKKSSTSE